ncbi:MAG: hypothetical protein ACYC27_12880 [Armatimonadota bacterium]
MDSTVDIRDLQRAASFIMIRKRLKFVGIGSIIFGILAIGIGLSTPSSLSSISILIIGTFLLAEGIWVITSPSPAGIMADSLAFLALGIWNIAAVLTGSVSTSFWLILGAFQLKWAYDRYKEYKIFSRIASEKPSPESMQMMEDMVKDIVSRNIDTSDDIIVMKLKGIPWKALLLDRAAVFVAANGRGVFIQNKEDMDLARTQGSDPKGILISGNVTSNLPAVMTPEHFKRYMAWKGITADTQGSEDQPEQEPAS